MKIGFDISQTGKNKAGCGFFADSLILELTRLDIKNRYTLYPNFGSSYFDPDAKITTRKITLPNVSRKIFGKSGPEVKQFWENLTPEAEKFLGNPDIIHANNFSCPKGSTHAKIVYTLYDLNFLQYPEFSTEQNRYVCFNGVFDASTHADFIISISEYTQKSFLEVFPHFPSNRIAVVPLGSRILKDNKNKCKSEALNGIKKEQFWLSVGTLEPRKNLRRLLKAFADFRKTSQKKFPLVLAGGKGWLEDDLDIYIENLNLTDDVVILGYVSDDDLNWLYKNCFAFIYPSIFEGFGLPVLEAMYSGAPVIASNTTSIPEVGGDAVYYVNPFKQSEMFEAFSKLENNHELRLKLKHRSMKQAEKFSWNKCGSEVLKIYQKVASMPKRL